MVIYYIFIVKLILIIFSEKIDFPIGEPNEILLQFETDEEGSSHGFHAEYRQIPCRGYPWRQGRSMWTPSNASDWTKSEWPRLGFSHNWDIIEFDWSKADFRPDPKIHLRQNVMETLHCIWMVSMRHFMTGYYDNIRMYLRRWIGWKLANHARATILSNIYDCSITI